MIIGAIMNKPCNKTRGNTVPARQLPAIIALACLSLYAVLFVLYNQYAGGIFITGYAPVFLSIAVLISIPVLVFFILTGNRRLLTEIDILRKTEAELKNSEEKYRSFFENAVEGIYRTTPEGRFIIVNPTLARMAGYESPQDMIDSITSVDQYYADPSDRARLISALNEKGMVKDYICRHKRKDGSFVWTSNNSRIVRDENGGVLYFEGTLEDITKRKQAEEALRENEEKYRSLINNVNIGIYRNTSGSDARFIEANPRMAAILGYDSVESFMQTPVLSHYRNPDDRIPFLEEIRRKGFVKDWELSLQRKDGSFIWCSCNATAQFDEEGNIKWTDGVIEDITERKKMKEALLDSEQKLISIVYGSPLPQFVIDRNHKVLYWNKALEELTGIKAEEMIGTQQHWRAFYLKERPCMADLLVDESESCIPEWYSEQLKSKLIADAYEATDFLPAPGKWLHFTAAALRDSRGNIMGAITTLEDITERKQAQEALQKLNEELEQRVIDRTESMETANLELILITTELERANSELKSAQSHMLQQEKMASIGQLAAGVAHEINNPMGFIISNLGSLDRYVNKMSGFIKSQTEAISRLAAEGSPLAGIIAKDLQKERDSIKLDFIIEDLNNLISESLEGSDRVKKIVQDLKSFSHVDEAVSKMTDINACLDSSINILWNELKYKTTVIREYGDIPRTKCNPGQLNQVFMNILINAVQSIETQGEIRVTTSVVNTNSSDRNIRIEISDTGCGIPADKLNRIFEPFFTTKDVGKGTGLGLSIVYDIIKKHDGEINIESEVDKGTTFTVTLPVVPE
jgi:two-component system, NtrC family, sensor kinase